MNKLLSCRYNMDTNRVEARFEDETTLPFIDCIAIEDEYGNTPAQRAELDWLLYNKLGVCPACAGWGRLSVISRLVATTAGWKITDKQTQPRFGEGEAKARAVFNEGEMRGISGHRFNSNCSAVMVALPSAAKVMPSADWG